jgi:hypothetical protein
MNNKLTHSQETNACRSQRRIAALCEAAFLKEEH